MKESGWEAYADIIDRARPVSQTHAPMPVEDRAAQFAPFAALTGYGSAIERTARAHEADVAQQVEHIEWFEDS